VEQSLNARTAHVLVVDPDGDSRLILHTLLERDGYAVQSTGDGNVALAAVRAGRPAVVVAELYVPHAAGRCIAAAIKGAPETRRVPVLVHTASVLRRDREWALELGCDAFVEKPIAVTRLLAEVRRLAGAAAAPAD
jgi:CheY-like chemotaxis protein